jgi:uncharacterized protein YbjT (DUF2867 family)
MTAKIEDLMKIVVLGGTELVGSALLSALVAENPRRVAPTGFDDWLRRVIADA